MASLEASKPRPKRQRPKQDDSECYELTSSHSSSQKPGGDLISSDSKIKNIASQKVALAETTDGKVHGVSRGCCCIIWQLFVLPVVKERRVIIFFSDVIKSKIIQDKRWLGMMRTYNSHIRYVSIEYDAICEVFKFCILVIAVNE